MSLNHGLVLLAITFLMACSPPIKPIDRYPPTKPVPVAVLAVDDEAPTRGERLLVDAGVHTLKLWCRGETKDDIVDKTFNFGNFTVATLYAMKVRDGGCIIGWSTKEGNCSYCAEIRLPPNSDEYWHMIPELNELP